MKCFAENLLRSSAHDAGLIQCFLYRGACFMPAFPGARALEERVPVSTAALTFFKRGGRGPEA